MERFEDKNWLDEALTDAIGAEDTKPNFEKWKEQHPKAIEMLTSRVDRQPSAVKRPLNIRNIFMKSPITKLAVAAAIFIAFGIGFSTGRWSKPARLVPHLLDVTAYTSTAPAYPTAPKAEDSFWQQKALAVTQPRPYAQPQFTKTELLSAYKQYLKEMVR